VKAFLDTNVVLDLLLAREPFCHDSRCVLEKCERGEVSGVVSALTFSTVAYVLEKAVGAVAAVELIRNFRKTVSVSPVSAESVDWAIQSKARDFEDAMQYESARSVLSDVIVTRDPSGFVGAKIRVMSPSEFLQTV